MKRVTDSFLFLMASDYLKSSEVPFVHVAGMVDV